MNLKELILFGMEESQEPVIKNPILQAALREPRPMAHGGRPGYQGGQLVDHGPGRQGYNGEPKVSKIGKRIEARTTELSPKELYKDSPKGPFKRQGITGDKLKWFNTFHFNNPESPYHNTMWEDLPGKRFASGKVQWASKELNDRYKTHVNQIQEYNKLTKQGWIPASDYFEKNGIDNWKLQALTREKQLTRNQWFDKNIQIKKIHTAVGGASRSYWIKEPDAKITKDFVKQFSFSDEKLFKDTQKNINDLWGHKPFKQMYLNGQYPKLTEVSSVFDMTNSQAATATRRIAQLMGGTTFSNAQFKNVPLDKKAAKGMLEQFSKEQWETPYAHANRRVDTAILEENLRPYKGKLTLQTYRRRALGILRKRDIPIMYKKGKEIITPGFNINEITGLSSGAGNKTFTSTQFINLMEGQLNQEGHARLMREYKKYEGLLNEALSSKKGTVYHKFWKQEGKEHTARELINKWKQYRTNWTNALPEKLKSSVVKGGLPGFSLDQNAATKLFGQKRLNQLVNDLKLPIVKEMEQKGYLKTWGEELGLKKQQKLMSETPVLKELVDNPDTAMRFLKKVGYRCRKAGGAGESVDCYMDDVKKTRANMKSQDVTVRAEAFAKQRNAFKIAKNLPKIGKVLKTAVQMGTAAITTPLKWLGFGSVGGYLLEGLVEGGFYDNAKRKGYSDEQAMAETFTPGLIAGRPEGVPWHGGSEKLREKELYEIKGKNEFIDVENRPPMQDPTFGKVVGVDSKVKQYVDALKEQDRIYETIGAKEEAKEDLRISAENFDTLFLPGNVDEASADVQDLARSRAYRRVDQTLKPGSMASQAYNTAVENRDALDQRRRREYLEKVDPDAFEREQKSFDTKKHREKRYRQMEEKYPDYSKEDIDYLLKNMYGTSMDKLGSEYSYEGIGNFFKDKDKSSYFADNFRYEKAGGGRVAFGAGGIDKGRRAFMQWIAGLTGAGIVAGTGLLKWGKVAGKGKTIVKAGDDIIQGTSGMPDWYIPLINRIVKEGTDVTKKLGTVEREIVHTKSISKTEDVTVYRNTDTGNVRVEYGPSLLDDQGKVIRASNDERVVHLEYKAGEVIEEGKHAGKKTKSEFSAAEAKPRVTNWEGDIEWEHMDIDKNVDDLLTPTHKLKEFAKKKLTHKDKVIAKKKQKYKTKLEKDPSEQLDYVENKEGMTIDDLVDEDARVIGEIGNPDTKLMNLPDKIKKASGGRVSYFDGGIVSLKKKW